MSSTAQVGSYSLGIVYLPGTIPYHTIPYHTIPYHTIPYRTILICTKYGDTKVSHDTKLKVPNDTNTHTHTKDMWSSNE